jgi:hypothetical protein
LKKKRLKKKNQSKERELKLDKNKYNKMIRDEIRKIINQENDKT